MDDRLRISLWIVTTSSLGIVLGGMFGALAGALHAHAGTTGTRFGRKVADSFARLEEEELSPRWRGALTGAADGVLFLGLVGAVGGVAAATFGGGDAGSLLLVSTGSICLVVAAAFFGLLAHAMTQHGVGAIFSFFAGGLLGSLLAGLVLGAEDCLVGTAPGLAVGLILCHVPRRYRPVFRPPQVLSRNREEGASQGPSMPGSPQVDSGETSVFRPGSGEER